MKNVLNAVARIKHSKEILNLNILHMLKHEHFSAANVDMFLKVGRMKRNQIKIFKDFIISSQSVIYLIFFLYL